VSEIAATEGTLLAGRVRYAQPATGYRTGIEPVLLAACVPANPGDRVLEFGTGAGAGLLCLAARVPGLRGVGVERDAGQAALARANVASNGFDGLTVEHADALAWRADDVFDHAFANPPWHGASGSVSADTLRAASKTAAPETLAAWASAMARALKPRGTLSLILPAASLAEAMVALTEAACAEIRVLPLWPRHGTAAKIVILHAFHQGRGGCTLAAGLILHNADGSFTDAAQSVLRLGAALLAAS
jgi:tRNA1(Val) A37 N6-methylase TrmN6